MHNQYIARKRNKNLIFVSNHNLFLPYAHVILDMTPQDDKVRVNARIPKELYDSICQRYDSLTIAINEALELLVTTKDEKCHMGYDSIRQPDIQELRARIDDLKAQVDILNGQLNTKDTQIEKQAFHIQSLIQENSRLNIKLLPEVHEAKKKPWYKFW